MSKLWVSDAATWDLVLTVLVKLGIGAFLGSLIGWERERSGRPAGIRTHMLVVIGVILYTEVSKAFPGADPSRVAAQIVTGIGFLGAGTILRNGMEIKGLTTAASIWAVAGIGMCVGVGGALLYIAIIATILAMMTLTVVDNIEIKLIPEAHPSELYLTLESKTDVVTVLEALGKEGLQINETRIIKTEPQIEMVLKVTGDKERILRTACTLPGVLNTTWSR